jgi:phosphatidylinositol alpha-mannosyltransferase
VRKLLREFRPDVCHAHEPFAPSIALWAGVQTPAPLVVTFHAHCDLRIGPALYSLGTWPLNRRAAAGIAVSPAAISCLHRRVRVPFHIVPNGVDARFVAIQADRSRTAAPRILFAHRLEPRKGFGVLLEAFPHVVAAVPAAELTVIGGGSDVALLDRLPPDVRARIRVRGSLSREALVQEFAEASVFVAPAVNGESFGVVLVEAMAASLPIVASDIAGYREVLAGGGAVLVPPLQPRLLADALTRVLTSPDLANALGASGRRQAERFSWPRVTDAIEAVYDAVMAPARMELKRAAI